MQVDELLIRAVRAQRVDAVDALLSGGASVHVADGDGLTALHHAGILACPTVFERLLERGAALEATDRWGRTPVMAICAHATVRRDVPVHAQGRRSAAPLTYPKHLQTLGLALLWGAAVDRIAANGYSAVHSAATHGASDVLRMLLDANADPGIVNFRRYSPLHAAADNGELTCVRVLVEAGAPIDRADHYGFTPLHSACAGGHGDIAAFLVERGADPAKKIAKGHGVARPGMNAADLARAAGFDFACYAHLGLGQSTLCG